MYDKDIAKYTDYMKLDLGGIKEFNRQGYSIVHAANFSDFNKSIRFTIDSLAIAMSSESVGQGQTMEQLREEMLAFVRKGSDGTPLFKRFLGWAVYISPYSHYDYGPLMELPIFVNQVNHSTPRPNDRMLCCAVTYPGYFSDIAYSKSFGYLIKDGKIISMTQSFVDANGNPSNRVTHAEMVYKSMKIERDGSNHGYNEMRVIDWTIKALYVTDEFLSVAFSDTEVGLAHRFVLKMIYYTAKQFGLPLVMYEFKTNKVKPLDLSGI